MNQGADPPLDFQTLDSSCIKRTTSHAEYWVHTQHLGNLLVRVDSRMRQKTGRGRFHEWKGSIEIQCLFRDSQAFLLGTVWVRSRERAVEQTESLIRDFILRHESIFANLPFTK